MMRSGMDRRRNAPRAILFDLLMATMDSMRVWAIAAGDRDRGLAWRDAVTQRMIAAGRYVAYERLVTEVADDLDLGADAPGRLRSAWQMMRPWPDATTMRTIERPWGFVTNCSTALAETAVGRSGLTPSMTITAEEAGWYKPRPEIYRLACERIDLEPAEVMFVAGAAYDANGAARAGLDARLVVRRAPAEAVAPGVLLATTLDGAITIE